MQYTLREFVPDFDNAEWELGQYSPLKQALLWSRGVRTKDSADKFLNPDYERDLHDPFLMKDMDIAVPRIIKAIQNNEKIVIYADYDCDGIPGAVILHDFFKKINYKNTLVYIPHRYTEGYGLNMSAVEKIHKHGANLIITVDCGITDSAEVERAKEFGMEVIITDHHLPIIDKVSGMQIIPTAFAVLNNKQEDDNYPFKDLCGAGTAFKLVQALCLQKEDGWEMGDGWEKWLLDMAGLATIADMVPLQGENRALAYFGLKVLRKSRRPGLAQLFRVMRVAQANVSEDDVGFMIAPRINAASRMSEPKKAFRMLATEDISHGGALADEMHRLNDRRKGLVVSMVREANARLEDRVTMQSIREVIVLGKPSWSPGLLGLAANKLVEQYERPVFLWGKLGASNIKGSCRSDGSVNMVDLMSATAEDTFIGFGGHEMSGGFSVHNDRVHSLEDALVDAFSRVGKKDHTRNNKIMVDALMALDDITLETERDISCLAPFGVGNTKPIFLFENIEIVKARFFGKERNHLELIFNNSKGRTIKAIEFFSPHCAKNSGGPVCVGDIINMIASIELSFFGGTRELRLRIINIV